MRERFRSTGHLLPTYESLMACVPDACILVTIRLRHCSFEHARGVLPIAALLRRFAASLRWPLLSRRACIASTTLLPMCS